MLGRDASVVDALSSWMIHVTTPPVPPPAASVVKENNDSPNGRISPGLTSPDDCSEAIYAAGWSDGLPCVPPTHERVERMLSGTARARDEVLGLCPPMYKPVTVALVAANTVMAGCEPRHLRVVLAACEAMLSDAFNLHGVHATTMGATPAVLVSGPVRVEAGLNSAHGALGSGTRANASIGRAVKLVLQNVGGAVLGGTESTTLGSPSKYSLCIAEAEEALDRSTETPRWLPYHVASRGRNAGDSAVTVLACTSGPSQLVDFATRSAPELLHHLGAHLASAYGAHMPQVNEALVVLSPEHMLTLRRGGVASKAAAAQALWHCANRASSRHLVGTVCMAKPGVPRVLLVPPAALAALLAFLLSQLADLLACLLALVAPSAALAVLPLHSLVVGQALPKFLSPASLHILVAGAPAGKFSSFCSGFGIGAPPRSTAHLSMACTAAVEPPPPSLAHLAEGCASPYAEKPAKVSSHVVEERHALLNPTAGAGAAPPLPPTARLPDLLEPAAELKLAAESPAESPASTAPVLGLLDISKYGGSILLDRLEAKLRAEHPSLRCRRFRKPTFSRPMPAALAAEVAEHCTCVVAALAD